MNKTTWRRGLALAIPLLAIAGMLVSGGCGGPSSNEHSADSKATGIDRREASSPAFAKSISNIEGSPRPNMNVEPAALFRQVVRKGDLSVRVENVEKAEKDVSHIVEGVGGFVETSSSKDLANHPELNLVLRVPSPEFENVVTKFEGLGVRLEKSIETQDVTNQLAAIEAHLQALRAQEASMRIAKKKAQGEDKSALENQLANVHDQIQSTLSDKNSQANVAALSTITLNLQQGSIAGASGNDPKWLMESLGQATGAAGTVFRLIITVILWALIFSPIWIPVGLVARKIRMRPQVRQTAPPFVS